MNIVQETKTIFRGEAMKKLISTADFEALKMLLENIKKDFNKYKFSLVFSVVDNNRMSVTITDRQEKKPYCGISSRNIDDVEDFLRKNLEKIKKIA